MGALLKTIIHLLILFQLGWASRGVYNAYNSRDQLTSETLAGVTTSYAYDRQGRQIAKTKAGEVTSYTWVDNDRLASADVNGVLQSFNYTPEGMKVKDGAVNFLWDPTLPYGNVLAEYSDNLTATVIYTFGQERIAQTTGAVKLYYLTDGTGSVRMLADEAGVITDTYGYTAFGEILYEIGDTPNRFRYTGEEFDPNLGMTYLRARWLDNTSGHFLGVDPYSGDPMSPVSLHRYLYANASPVSMSDPSGNMTLVEQLGSIGAQAILASIVIYTYNEYLRSIAYSVGVPFELNDLINSSISEILIFSENVEVAWHDAISMLRDSFQKVKKEVKRIEKKNRDRKIELLISGPSTDNGGKLNNWQKPIKQGYARWYRDGGPYSGRVKGFGIWDSRKGLQTLIPVGEFDNHPITGDPIYGPDKYLKVYHFHIGSHKGPHYIVGGIKK